MNKNNFDKLIANYMEKYDFVNNEENNEIYKWVAIHHFQSEWNIEAQDFGEMFKRAMSKSSNIVDNSIVQPTGGIMFLCRQDKATEEKVRDAFRNLLQNDGGDIKVRQDKIDSFIATINGLLSKVAPGKWKYDQDRRAVILYLSFIMPDENYIFKATEARAYANCVEYGGDIGSGQNFKLANYYAMCDELVARIEENAELVEMMNRLLEEEVVPEVYDTPITEMKGKLNILAYDIMYCANAYDLYGNIPIVKKSKGSSKTEKQNEKKTKQEILSAKRLELDKLLDEVETECAEIVINNLQGMEVKHLKFGLGVVSNQDNAHITIRFDVGEKVFAFPDAFTKGFLKTSDTELMEKCKKKSELLLQQGKYAAEIRMLNVELNLL